MDMHARWYEQQTDRFASADAYCGDLLMTPTAGMVQREQVRSGAVRYAASALLCPAIFTDL